jgi:hypothetical protein
LFANSLLVGFAPAVERNDRHALTPNALKKRRSRLYRDGLHTVIYYDQAAEPVT